MKKDIFIDNNTTQYFSNPIDEGYSKFIAWISLNWLTMLKWKECDLKKIGQTKQRGSVPHLPIRDYCPHPSNH